MKLDDLKTEWKNEIEQPAGERDCGDALVALEKETSKLDKTVKRRDTLEISIALLMIPLWSWKLFYSAGVMQSTGLWIAIMACLFIPYKLINARKVVAPKNNNMLAFLKTEKLKLVKQKTLLESIAWWYISPLMLAVILITAGATVNSMGIPQITGQLAIYYLFCALLVVGVFLLNKRAAKKQFTPLLDKVNQRINEMIQSPEK